MSYTTKLALSLFLTALILGVVGDVLRRAAPWGINMLIWVTALCFGLVAVAQWNQARLTGGGRGQADRFGFGVLAAALGVLLILNVLNPDDFIVRVNAGRVETAHSFDASYVAGLSADAVPALIAALPAMPENDRCVTAARILERWSPPQRFAGLTWNLDRSLAWLAVGTNWNYLQSVACSNGRD